MRRFLIPSYIFNSIRIKTKAKILRVQNGSYPFDFYKDKVEHGNIVVNDLDYNRKYHSFSYFSLEGAQKYYENKPSLIHDIMLGIIAYNDMHEKGVFDQEHLTDIAKNIGKSGKYIDGLPHYVLDENYSKFDINGEVISGIVQGKASSFFLRVYEATNDDKYLGWAKSALLVCLKSRREGGVKLQTDKVKCWVEEYDSPKPSMVLNGFVFVLIAAAEFLSFEKSYELEKFFNDGMSTLLAWLPKFKQDGDVLYSMYHWDLANVHYMGVMKYQFEHLYQLTKVEELNAFVGYLNENLNMKTFEKITVKA